MYRNILILDTETTGLDPDTDYPIEVGCVLWNVEHASMLQCWSVVMEGDTAGPTWIHGISDAVAQMGVSRHLAIVTLLGLVDQADAIVAHNADFDRGMLPELDKPWIDSMDIQWPNRSPKRTLTALALAHGIPVVSAHRALSDCLLLGSLFERAAELGMDVQESLRLAARPKVKVRAFVSYEGRQLAKDAGFYWGSYNGRKMWQRDLPLEEIEKAEWGFDSEVVS